VLRVRCFPLGEVRRIAPKREIACSEIARERENSQEENTGWQNRVRVGNIDNFSSRRYAHFCASAAKRARRRVAHRHPRPTGDRDFIRIPAFSFVYALSVGPFVVCNPRAACTHEWEWAVCDSQFVCVCWWLVWHVSRTQARTVITSKYVSSWRILVRTSRNVSSRSLSLLELSYRLKRSPLSRNTAVLVRSWHVTPFLRSLAYPPRRTREYHDSGDLIAIEFAESV